MTTDEGESIVITLSGTDPDQDPLTYEIVSNPAHGITNVSGNEVVYIPASNYFGPDVFAFTVSTDEDVAISIFLAGITTVSTPFPIPHWTVLAFPIEQRFLLS